MAENDPRLRAERISKAAILVPAAICALELIFVVQLRRGLLLAFVWLSAVLALWIASRWVHERRLKLAKIALPVLAVAFLAEMRLGRGAPRDGAAASRRGVAFDTRTVGDVVRDERAGGTDAYPSTLGRDGIQMDGRLVMPLGGAANKKTILCNEGGEFATYTSDEYGFNNPPRAWGGRGTVEVGIVGEAFMAGACVPSGKSAADMLRARFPGTVNLGMVGNGPLRELGGVLEHLGDVRPKIVLWAYYHNDLATMNAELRQPVLRAYLESEARQGLRGMQHRIDEALAEAAKRPGALGSTWPGALSAVGLTRRRTPMFLTDLIMGEDHSSTGAAMRFDKLSGFVQARTTFARADPLPLAEYKRALEKAKRIVSSWGGTLQFVYLADLHHLRGPEHPLRQPVLDIVREVGLPLIDVQPAFAAVPDPMTLRYHAESHLDEEGNRLLGQTVLNALR